VKTFLRRFEAFTGGVDPYPLLALFLIFFIDEFDTSAFNVLAPDIRHAFHLTSAAFGVLVVANLSIVLLAAIPLGYYGDRLPRRNLVLVGAVLAGLFSFATGLAPFLALLVVFRLGNGLAIHGCPRVCLRQPRPDPPECHLELQPIAGKHIATEFGAVDTAQRDTGGLRRAGAIENQRRRELRQRLDHEHGRHQRRAGEMSLEIIFADRDVLECHEPVARLVFSDRVDQQ